MKGDHHLQSEKNILSYTKSALSTQPPIINKNASTKVYNFRGQEDDGQYIINKSPVNLNSVNSSSQIILSKTQNRKVFDDSRGQIEYGYTEMDDDYQGKSGGQNNHVSFNSKIQVSKTRDMMQRTP